MQISPHINASSVEAVYADTLYANTPKPVTGIEESPYSPETGKHVKEQESDEERQDFAEILAGLLHTTGTNETGVAVDVEDEVLAVPPAEAVDAVFVSMLEDVSFSGEHEGAVVNFGQKTETVSTETDIEPEKTLMYAGAAVSHEIKTELSAIDFSEEDQSLLLGVERLLSRSTEKVPLEKDKNTLSNEISLETGQDEAVVVMRSDAIPETAMIPKAAEAAEYTGKEPKPNQEKPTKAAAREIVPETAGAEDSKKLKGPAPVEQPVLRQKNEKEGKGRLEEARDRDKRRASFEVRDLRSGNGQGAESAGKPGETRVLAGMERVQPEGGTKEITLELRLPNQGQNASMAETSWEAKVGQAFEDLLARELHQNFNNDIVRHASMVLRDEGAGTIRLALKPETLGNVKIRLEMAENKITGHIVVESEEALRAFEREVHSLEQAFKDSGFQSANLEMSLASDGRGTEQNRQGADASHFLSRHLVASRYDAALEQTEMPLPAAIDLYRRGSASINVLA